MNFIVSAVTDIGITKGVNQDSFNVRVINTPQGKMVMAVLCDGMGGLSKGELASSTIVRAFCRWADERLPVISCNPLQDELIRKEWVGLLNSYSDKIKIYGEQCGINMGTTVTVLLLTQNRYYIINVGDTRAYEISDSVRQITKDHTVVAREVELGQLTEEEAETDYRRNVLLQCIGASDDIYPDMFFGDTKLDCVYMMCSDGFRHVITKDEMHRYLRPEVMLNADGMKGNIEALIELNKQRLENDNITAITIRTF